MYSEFWIGLDVDEYTRQMNNVRELMLTLRTMYVGAAKTFVEELSQLWFSESAVKFDTEQNVDLPSLIEPYSHTECLANLPLMFSSMANAIYYAISKAAEKVGAPNGVSIPSFENLPLTPIDDFPRMQATDPNGGTGIGKELAKAALSNFVRICRVIQDSFDRIPIHYGWPEDNVSWYEYFSVRIKQLKTTFKEIIDQVESTVTTEIETQTDRIDYGTNLAEKIMGETEAVDKIVNNVAPVSKTVVDTVNEVKKEQEVIKNHPESVFSNIKKEGE